ncbi:MAG TPA: 2TM domain-containing protein [Actinoplanes sp.]|nr:2TM domain-containing protein [Actinoplanes sp.]
MTTIPPPAPSEGDTALRQLAVTQLRKKRDLQAHVIAYVMVNLFLNGIWLLTGAGFYWPMFPLFGWGIGVAFHIWDVYAPEKPTEEQVRREMDRLSGTS